MQYPNTRKNSDGALATPQWGSISYILTWLGRVCLGLFLVLIIGGCGPYRSGAALRDAQSLRGKVIGLQRSDADASTVAYSMAKGDAFLRVARLAAGHSDHTGAIQFARTAREAYLQARITLESHSVATQPNPRSSPKLPPEERINAAPQPNEPPAQPPSEPQPQPGSPEPAPTK